MNYYCMPHKPPTWGCLTSGDKRESGPVLTPLWVEGRAAFVWGWGEPVTRAD